jgi:uncharacterized protein YbjT (DUF2867 family)
MNLIVIIVMVPGGCYNGDKKGGRRIHMYAICGATGNIGSKTADILLSQGERVTIIGRCASRLQSLVDRGAEAKVGDLMDGNFVARAFSDATAVFTMIPPNYGAPDFRTYQNMISDNLANGIVKAGVRHVVNLSSQGADLHEGSGPILGLREQELRFNQLEGVNVLHLRPTYFMENLLMNIPLINRMGIAGSAVHGELKFAMIATGDIADIVAKRMVRRDFAGKKVHNLLGERDLSLNEAVAVLGRRIGMPDLKYVQFLYEDAANGLMELGFSEDLSSLFIEMCEGLNNGLFSVGLQRTPENTTPTSIEEFAETFARYFESSAMRKAA